MDVKYYDSDSEIGHTKASDIQQNASKLCWNCCKNLTGLGTPIRVPYDTTGDDYLFDGSYCSLGCAKRSIIDKWCHQASTRMMWLNDAAGKVFGIRNAASVPAAPPKESLKDFGGPFTRKEFDSRVRSGLSVILVQKPLITFPMKIVEERSSILEASQQLSCLSLFEVHTKNIIQEKSGQSNNNNKTSLKSIKKRPSRKKPPCPTPPPSKQSTVPVTETAVVPKPPCPPKLPRKGSGTNTLYNYVLRSSSKKK